MNKRTYYIINAITIYRIVAAPFIIGLALFSQEECFRWLLAVSFLTDALDGIAARTFKVVTVAGARRDSIGDDLTVLAAIVGMVIFKPVFLTQHILPVVLLATLFVIQIFLALAKFGKMTSFHTYGAKVAAVAQAVFLLSLFFFPNEPVGLFYLAVVLTCLELIEEIIMVCYLPAWEADVKGLYWSVKRKNSI